MFSNIEIKRKFFHILSMVILIPYLYLNYRDYYYLLIFLSIFICFFDVLRTVNYRFRNFCHNTFSDILRQNEKNKLFCGISYMILGFLCAFIIAKNTSLYIASSLILIFVDAFSGLLGDALKHKYKNLLRFLFFFITSLLISYFVNSYNFVSNGNQIFGFYASNINIIIACMTTTLVEKYSRLFKIDDNFSVPISYALVIKICNYYI